MPDYRRQRSPGGTFFFTINLFDRRSDLLVREIQMLRAAVRNVRQRRPFIIDAWVVLPDHLHAVWTLPADDTDYAGRWRDIKRAFSRAIPGGEHRSASRVRAGDRGIWQRRYWEHTIRDDADYAAHVDYVHFNPVKHEYATSAAIWPYSSFRRAVAAGFYPESWSSPAPEPAAVGE